MASAVQVIENAEKKKNSTKPKDLLSLNSINDILTKTLDERHTWVIETERTILISGKKVIKRSIHHMKYQKNIIQYMFCDYFDDFFGSEFPIGNDQVISDLCSHKLTFRYLNKKLRSKIDKIVFDHNDIILKQSQHMEKIILFSSNLLYCCLEKNAYLFTDDKDRYIGGADKQNSIPDVIKFDRNKSYEDTLHLRTYLCNQLYNTFIIPISKAPRYEWLYKLLKRFNYINTEQSQVSEEHLYDFLAIILILALDLSDSSKSTEPYMRAVYSFFNIEDEFPETYDDYVKSTGFPSFTSELTPTTKGPINLIGQEIIKNQTDQELQEQLQRIIDLIIRDLLRNSQYVTLSFDFQEMKKHLNDIRDFYKSLRDDFNSTSSLEDKEAYVDELFQYYNSQRTHELPSLVSQLTIEKTR